LEHFPVAEPTVNERPLVVHAPSDRQLKGSDFVIKAVETLREEGLQFDFKLIEDMPNHEALEQYRAADIIIDQLLIGWYGVVSIEAMAMGKTVIAYVRDDLTGYFKDGIPLVNANPETITDVLRTTIKDGELRREFGSRGRAFVEQMHDSRAVSAAAVKFYKKMIKSRPSPKSPDFSYQLGHSSDFSRLLNGDALRQTREQLAQLEAQNAALRSAAENEAGKISTPIGTLDEQRGRAERRDDLEPRLQMLVRKSERYDELEPELPTLRYKAARYDELRQELPALRFKSKRYDEWKDQAPTWRRKAERLDRLASRRWVRLVLPLFGLSLAAASRRERKQAARKTGVESGPAGPASTDRGAGKAEDGDPAGPTLPGSQPERLAGAVAPAPPGGAADHSSVTGEFRAILRIGRVADWRNAGEAGSGAGERAAISAPARREAAPSLRDTGVVCIVSRKRLNNITRAPRMAKALVDAGYEVVVVSLGRPVSQLLAMCPKVQYVEVKTSPLTRTIANRCEDFRRKQRALSDRRDLEYQAAVAGGGLPGLAQRLGRAARAPGRLATRLLWNLFVVTPCALLLKKRSQRFAQRWRELALQDAVGIASELAAVQNQRWLTHSFADAVEKATRPRRFDIVQAYDNYALVAAQRLAVRDGAKLIYDAVELASHRLALDLHMLDRRRERAERREEAAIARTAAGMIAIGDGVADWYARHYRRPRPLVVRNCRYFWPYEVDGRLRADAGVGPEARLLVWVGSLYPQQGIEILIKALPFLAPSIHLAIIGFVQPFWKSYAQEVLPALAASAAVADRVHLLPAREPNDIVPYISGADVGVVPRSREYLNNFFSMPNKFLEMVMARLPIAVSQLGDMVDLIKKYDMGSIFDERDPRNIAVVVEAMLEPSRFSHLKSNVMKAAEILTWEEESQPYVELVGALMPASLRTGVAARRETPHRPSPSPVAAVATMPSAAGGQHDAKDGGSAAKHRKRRGRLAYFQAMETNQKLRDAVGNLRNLSEYYRESTNVNHFLRFARYCYERADDIKAEAYLAHGVEALPAADAVAKAVGGRVYCDVIEMPSFAQRSVPYELHPTSLSLLDHAFDGYLRGAAGLSTVGWALGDRLRHYGPKVAVIPNYRSRETPPRSSWIREACGLASGDRLLLATSTIASGLEPIIEALRLLPDHIHLATLGNIFHRYRGPVDDAVSRCGLGGRVHLLDPVPYDRLAAAAGGADIGLIAVDPSLTHWQISLPNRLFDCIAAGLPVVTPDLPDISRIVRAWGLGMIVAESAARSWADAISAALADEEALRARARAAAGALVWESLADDLLAAYDSPASITIIAYTDLIGHQRTIRMAETLAQRGVRVTVCCPHEAPVAVDAIPGARVVPTPRPLPAPARAVADSPAAKLRPAPGIVNRAKASLSNGKAGGVSLLRALRLFPANRNDKGAQQQAAPS
jgi:glycosyltransferase involved in cell wall biosynthesis